MRRFVMLALCLPLLGCYGTISTRVSGGLQHEAQGAFGWPLFEAVHADAWMVGKAGERQDAYFRMLVWASFPLDAVLDVVLLPADVVAGLLGWERGQVPSAQAIESEPN